MEISIVLTHIATPLLISNVKTQSFIGYELLTFCIYYNSSCHNNSPLTLQAR